MVKIGTKIGIRAFPDTIEEASHFDVDYFEVAVRLDTDAKRYNPLEGRIKGIHGAILSQGVNFMNHMRTEDNRKAVEKAIEAADMFDSKYIVFHPGYIEIGDSCGITNLVDLMKGYDDRLHLEVVPVLAYKERLVFPVHTVDDYKRLKDKTRKGFVLDLGHAMITARARHYDPVEYIGRLMEELDIKIVHVADNDDRKDGCEDSHLHIGEGNVPIEQILRQFKGRLEFATIEVKGITPKDIELVTTWLR